MKITTTTKQLRRQTYKFKHKIALTYIKRIIKLVKSETKNGNFYCKIEAKIDYGMWEAVAAAKWLDKHTDLDINISRYRHCDSVEILITW